MQVLILGVGDAFTRKHFSTSALVRTDAGYTLIDCPDLIHRALWEADQHAAWNVSALSVTDVIITHLHGDHCNGLESFAFLHRMKRRQDPALPMPRLHVTPPVADRIWERLAPAMDSPMGSTSPSTIEDYFDLHTICPDAPTTINGLHIKCRYTGHPIPTIGLKLQSNDSTLGWSGDTPFEQAHIDWLNDADLIVHESNVGPAHTDINKLNALPDETRRKMRLIHLQDSFDPSCTDIKPLKEGDVLKM